MAAAFDRPDEASRRRSGVTPQRRRCRGFMTHLNRNKHSFQQVELKQQRRRRRLPLELSFTSQKSSRLFTSVSRFSLSRVWCEFPGGSPLSCLPFASGSPVRTKTQFSTCAGFVVAPRCIAWGLSKPGSFVFVCASHLDKVSVSPTLTATQLIVGS